AVFRIVDSGVDDLGIARADAGADRLGRLQHQDLASGPRQPPGDGESDHARADNHRFDRFDHARRLPHWLAVGAAAAIIETSASWPTTESPLLKTPAAAANG